MTDPEVTPDEQRISATQLRVACRVGYFTVTFCFAARHRSDLVALPIAADLRRQAAEAEMTGRMLPLVIEVCDVPGVASVLDVMRYKLTAT